MLRDTLGAISSREVYRSEWVWEEYVLCEGIGRTDTASLNLMCFFFLAEVIEGGEGREDEEEEDALKLSPMEKSCRKVLASYVGGT